MICHLITSNNPIFGQQNESHCLLTTVQSQKYWKESGLGAWEEGKERDALYRHRFRCPREMAECHG
jgi:hypothetical protein